MGPLSFSTLGTASPAAGWMAPPAGLDVPALAAWETDALDRWWHAAGRPDPYTAVEVGAAAGRAGGSGGGRLAREVLGLGPECLTALRYVLVGEAGPEIPARLLPIEAPELLFPAGPFDPEDPEGPAEAAIGIGPLVTSLKEVPVLPGVAAVIAVASVGALPADRVEWRHGRWWEVRVAAGDTGLYEILVELDDERSLSVGALIEDSTGGGRAPEGGRYALHVGAVDWLSRSLRTGESGVLAIVDRWTQVTSPLDGTAPPPLALDQLKRVREPLDISPVGVVGDLSVVSWRLG
jgi:hypothetical protein